MAGRKDQARGGSSGGGSVRERSDRVGAVRCCGVNGSETAMPPAIGTASEQQAWVAPAAWGAQEDGVVSSAAMADGLWQWPVAG